MLGVRAEHVYLGLQRLQFRYGTEVIQAYTDKGSQLGKMLGKRNDYWSTKLCGMIKIFNNAALAEFRNVCEHKVRILKRLLKMGITGKPVPQV